MKALKISASIGLGLCFVLIYGFCNNYTATRSGVGMIYFEWEHLIPLIPIFIIPYMSIDLLFVAAPWLCKSKRELKIFSIRIVVSILIAATFYLLLPLKFAFPRPEVEGVLGPIFRLLYSFDQPFNLFPSLHIILRTILADQYAKQSRGGLKIAVAIWFSLIGFSTIFTFQHHICDIIGGFAVALFVIYLFPYKTEQASMIPNRRIGYYFAAISGLCASLCFISMLLLWPAISCLIIAIGYWKTGPSLFRKVNGQIPISTRFMLLPYFLGQSLYLRSYYRRCNRWDEIVPGVFVGRKLNASEAKETIARCGITSVVDLTAEFTEPKPFRDLHYLNLQTMDLTAPSLDQLETAIHFIEEGILSGSVYIHCKIGYSRSVAITAAYLIHSNKAKGIDEAIALIQAKRPTIIVRPEIEELLHAFVETSDEK